MNKPKRQWNVTLVDVLVGFAVLMILSALVVPIFFPPVGKAASRVAASTRSAVSVNR
jgi:type II secretory pathway pseudopilin PulG